MRFIICYDISDDKKRNKVSKKLKAYGIRSQYSVFEIEAEKETILGLLEEIDLMLDEIDKFFIYPVKEPNKIKRIGRAQGNIFTIV